MTFHSFGRSVLVLLLVRGLTTVCWLIAPLRCRNAMSIGQTQRPGYLPSLASGETTVLPEPSGAGCMPGGLWPCGLSGGAPPVPVLIGPVLPCGCFSPTVSGVCVRPVL